MMHPYDRWGLCTMTKEMVREMVEELPEEKRGKYLEALKNEKDLF